MSDWPEAIVRTFVAWEAFRRLGFDSSELFVGATSKPSGDGAIYACIELISQDRRFRVYPALWPKDPVQFNIHWKKFAEQVTGEQGTVRFTDDELSKFWDQYKDDYRVDQLSLALLGRGFYIPALEALKGTWNGPRTVEQVIERYASELGSAMKQMVEQSLSTRSHIGIMLERGFEHFSVLSKLVGMKPNKQHQVFVFLLDRSDAIKYLGHADIQIPETFLAMADSSRSLPVVVCGPEGFSFGSVAVEVNGPTAKA